MIKQKKNNKKLIVIRDTAGKGAGVKTCNSYPLVQYSDNIVKLCDKIIKEVVYNGENFEQSI